MFIYNRCIGNCFGRIVIIKENVESKVIIFLFYGSGIRLKLKLYILKQGMTDMSVKEM